MAFDPVQYSALKLARQRGYRPQNPGLFKVGPQGRRTGSRVLPPALGGGGWTDPLAKEPSFQSPGLDTGKYRSKGTPVRTKGYPTSTRPGGPYPPVTPRPGGGSWL